MKRKSPRVIPVILTKRAKRVKRGGNIAVNRDTASTNRAINY